jgi:oligopeptidase A
LQNQLLDRAITRHDIDFSNLPAQHFREAIDTLLPKLKAHHEYIATDAPLTFEALFETDETSRQLGRIVGLLHHLTSVAETPELRDLFAEYMPVIATTQQEMQLDERVPARIKAYLETEEAKTLDPMRARIVQEIIRNYEREGVYLEASDKESLMTLQGRETELTQQFDCNLSDFDAAAVLTFSIEQLQGVPPRTLENATLLEDGRYEVTRVSGGFADIVTYCEVEETRKTVYEYGLNEGKSVPWDNRPILAEIARIAHDRARLLGFPNYATYAMDQQMASSPAEALAFEVGLAAKSLSKARDDTRELTEFGTRLMGRTPAHHDFAYLGEKMCQARYSLDSEAMRKYFPVNTVVSGMFAMLEELYDITFARDTARSVWHQDVEVYEVVDKASQRTLGILYMDLFKRANKGSGAWMNPAQTRHVEKGETYLPVVYLVCNAPKDKSQEPTLEFGEVVTLFHEMGHTLHNILTEVDEEFFSGLSHVQHDAVELPSQFMENFCWDYSTIKLISRHVETGECLPESEFEKLTASRHFMAASSVLRTARYSMMDLLIYSNPDVAPETIETLVFDTWQTRERDRRNSNLTGFKHIFSGGYSAGYYAYQWAEMLSADAFAALKEEGATFLEQKAAAMRFRKHVLATGGLSSMADNFRAFRGRDPDLTYLLRDYGVE